VRTDEQRPGLVIHASSGELDALRAVLRYAANFVAAGDGTRRVDVVVNGPALDLVLADSDLREQVSELHGSGLVMFSACANTMAGRGVTAGDLHPATEVVPAAVVHLAQRQWGGWAYLRP
jgi:intracellular sulfur oxidation DsrE/DsrF family protein